MQSDQGQCSVCQTIYNKKFLIAQIKVGSRSKYICRGCAKLIETGLKRLKDRKDTDD